MNMNNKALKKSYQIQPCNHPLRDGLSNRYPAIYMV